MRKINILAVAIVLALFVIGCASGGTNSPPSEEPSNVYLPVGPAEGCAEIEVEWHTFMGSKENSFYSGREDLCVTLRGLNRLPDPPPIRVRCVTRIPGSSLTINGPWINGVKASSRAEFLKFCPLQTNSN